MRDTFSSYHPLTNFLYFLAVIGFSVVIQNPYYLLVSCLGGISYYLLLYGRKGAARACAMVPLLLLLTFINPIFNTLGETVLFSYFGRPYTLEALSYGVVIGLMLVGMLIWFGCYSAVLTSDKFVSLFGGLIPSLSLLLVMILRLIPSFIRKGRQIIGARRCIGKGGAEQKDLKGKLSSGIGVLSALTDWALEGSITTADSMRSRGYGAGKRTHYQPYRLTLRDALLIGGIGALSLGVMLAGGYGAEFGQSVRLDAPTWGLGAYGILMLIPSILRGKEALVWRISLSKI